LMLAQKYPAKIIAIERDPIAFSEANENIKAAGKNQQIQLQLISVQKFVPEIDYDYIICNPPFFKQSLKSPHAEKNLSKHEDNLPLELLVKFISMHLSTKGQAGILLPAYRGEEVLELLKKYVLYPAEIAFVQ